MVRVIPVHNFREQNVSQIEEPTASCVVNTPTQEYLLLATTSHCVEVHEVVGPEHKLVTTFPTVDLVQSILHCSKGNYVVTLETKSSRDNVHINNFVRVYVNWEQHDHRFAMRARIAGRVTPSLNRPMNGLEMIELPLSSQPSAIACCQKTGNLLVGMGCTAVLYEFKIETQQASKQKFVDFEARPWSLGFHFGPTKMDIVEDFISIMDSSHFVAFRLTNPFYEDIEYLGSVSSNNSSSNDKTTVSTDVLKNDCEADARSTSNYNFKTKSNDESMSYSSKDLSRSSLDKNSNIHPYKSKPEQTSFIDWDRLVQDERRETRKLLSLDLVGEESLPITVGLPSISLERIGPCRSKSPFELNSPDTEVYIKTTSPEDGWSENYIVRSILRLKIVMSHEVMLESGFEYFTCSVLKPLYLKINQSSCLKKSVLHSEEFRYLSGVTCLICTVQEGFVYHFSTDTNSDPICLTSYPFTAPVSHVVISYTALHALTEAGLESYTLRIPQYMARTFYNCCDTNIILPDLSEPACLIGLRPFLGIQQLLISRSFVVLLAKADESWTLYSLKLPSIEEIYFEILTAAKTHKNTNPTTYRHLLEESFSMLWLSKNVNSYRLTDHETQDKVPKLQTLYQQACALLGDFYVASDCKLHWHLGVQYFKMSALRPDEILARKSIYNAPGLFSYVSDLLLTINGGPEADALFQGSSVMDVIGLENREDQLKLILNSTLLREYATEKLIKLISTKEKDDLTRIALALLYIHADKQDHADKMIEPVSRSVLRSTLLSLPHLLFEETIINAKRPVLLSFSEFAGILIRKKTVVFADILTALIEKDHANLNQVIQAFMEYLPSRVGRDGHDDAYALQLFIETYLQSYFRGVGQDLSSVRAEIAQNYIIVEALKILVRSYLGKLMQVGVHKSDEENRDKYLFIQLRPRYLDKMPPCSKDFQKILNSESVSEIAKITSIENEEGVRSELIKLQALLASEILPQECLDEIERFLDTENVVGSLAFKTLIASDKQVVTSLLIENCPQAVLSYAKCKYTQPSEWEFLVEMLREKSCKTDIKPELKFFFEQTMIETLKHAAVNIPSQYLSNVFPKDETGYPFQEHVEICAQTVCAEHVKSLIKEMTQQLLTEIVKHRPQAPNYETSQRTGENCVEMNNVS